MMSFPDAIREIISGRKVTRLEWNNTDCGLLKDGYLMINRNGFFHQWLVNDGDLLALDWVTLPEGN